MSKTIYSLSEVARQLDVEPRVISDAFYQRRLDEKRCPMVGNRRIIPADYLAELKAVLRAIEKTKNDKRNEEKKKK